MRYLIILSLLLFGCSSTPETTEQFVIRFEKAMKNKDSKALQNCFLKSEKDVKKVLDLTEGPEQKESEIERIVKEIENDLLNMHHYIVDRSNNNWRNLNYSSIEHVKIKDIKEDLPKGYRATSVIIHYSSPNGPSTIKGSLMDLNTGKWMMVGKPRIER